MGEMTKKNFSALVASIILCSLALMPLGAAFAAAGSITLIRVYATLDGDTAPIGTFEANRKIDLVFEFELDGDEPDTARFTWDVYTSHGRTAHSAQLERSCDVGMNTVRISDAIPTDLAEGINTYRVYASVRVGDHKQDTEFEIRIDSARSFPGVVIEDVRLIPREHDAITSELSGAAIPYTLEIDFRVENILSWRFAEIRWQGLTVEGFMLDSGVATTDITEGFNTYTTESYIARPSSLAEPEAYFSVEVGVLDYYDSVSFPIENLPISLVELVAAEENQRELAFSIGEGYLVTEDGVRASIFWREEPIVARLVTGGAVPENTTVIMALMGGPDETSEEFMLRLEPGEDSSLVVYPLPMRGNREAGFYQFIWSVVAGETLFAERIANLTLSNEQGANIPVVIDLPGPARLTVPIDWQVTEESEPGKYATLTSPAGVICRISGETMETALRAEFLANLYESDPALSGIPADVTLMTTESNELEGVWEFSRRAYLGTDHVYVYSYWLYRIEEGLFEFLVARCTGDEDQVDETYEASDRIMHGLAIVPET